MTHELAPGLVREAFAPERLVVVWTRADLSPLMAGLVERGEMPLLIPPAETSALLAESGAPALLLVDADLLDDATEDELRRFRQEHPQTRACALADESTSAAGLLRAMRAGLGEVIDPGDPREVDALADTLAGGSADKERVLVVGAHPDDVEIGCGATLLRHRAAGDAITVLTMSRGAVGGLQETRRQEAVGAALMLGADLIMGDLPDTRIGEAHEAISLIESVIEATAPTTLYVHSKWDNHQDHRAVHDATMVAARRVPQVLCYQSPSSRNGFDPTRFVPVTETIQDKVRLLGHYRSQSTRHYLDPELVVASARYWARQLPHTRYVEPFEVIRASERDRFSTQPT